MNRDFHLRSLLLKTVDLAETLNHVNERKEFSTTMSKSCNLCFHSAEGCLRGLQLRLPQDRTISNLDDESCSTLDTGRVTGMFVSVQTTKICVRISFDIENIRSRGENQSLITCTLEIQTDPDESFFVRLAWREHVPRTTVHSIGNIGTRVTREIEQHSNNT